MGLASDSLSETLKYFRRALDLDPSYADAYHEIGDAVFDFAPEQAASFYRTSLALDPRQDIVRIDLAGALALLDREADIDAALKGVARTGPVGGVTTALLALNDLQHARYAPATAAVAAMPNVKSVPSFWALLVGALRLGGRTDEALREASALVARFPQDCEGTMMLAALKNERREAAAAHKLADVALVAASRDAALPAEIRCGLHAAAAVQNGQAAAAMLNRVAGTETMLRAFAEVVMGRSGTMWIDPRTYPWSLIARQPAVVEARRAPRRGLRPRTRRRASGVEGLTLDHASR